MTRQHAQHARSGFTLVEVMVVILIISILASLSLVALGKARESARRASASVEIGQIAAAVTQFKANFHVDYLPAGGSGPDGTGSNGTFMLQSVYPANPPMGSKMAGQNSFEANYLKMLWPQLLVTTTPSAQFPTPGLQAPNLPTANLDANQTLVFFLTGGSVTSFSGFSTNKQSPFTTPTSGQPSVGPFLTYPGGKYQTGTAPNGAALSANGNSSQPSLVDPWGFPYAYMTFIPGSGYNTPVPAGSTTLQSYTFNGQTVQAYSDSTGRNLNPKGFQIITCGHDGFFGAGGSWSPGTGSWTLNGYGADDMSNFNSTVLATQD